MKASSAASAALLAAVVATGCAAPRARWDPDRTVQPPLEVEEPDEAAVPAARPRVILLPEDDGSVGHVDVEIDGSVTELDEAYAGVYLDPPHERFVAKPDQLAAEARPTFEVLPPASRKWILYYELDTTELVPESRAALDELLAAVARWPAAEIWIDGHADRSGTEDRNRALSRDRAQAVQGAIEASGAQPVTLEVAWHGEDRPAKPTPDGAFEPLNRRVEVRIR